MSEALAKAVPQPREDGPGTRLIALLDRAGPEAVNEAAALTFEMATEVAEWSDGWGPRLKRWWVEQYRLKRGDQAALDAGEVWIEAEADARSKTKVVPAPLFSVEAQPKIEPEGDGAPDGDGARPKPTAAAEPVTVKRRRTGPEARLGVGPQGFAEELGAAIAAQNSPAGAAAAIAKQAAPEAEPEPEPATSRALVPVALPEVLDSEALLLNSAVPFDNAEKLIEAYHWHGEERVRTLMHYQNEYWKWGGTHWAVVSDDTMRANVWKQLHVADKFGKRGRERFEPKTSDVSWTMDALKGSTDLPPENTMPAWFGKSPVDDPLELVACQNGLLHLPTRRLWPHSPRFWSPNVLEFGFDPTAKAPRFKQFLQEIFPGDREAQDGLLEMFGLCVTDITKFQKAFMFVGPTRGGRGTIGRVLQGLIGKANYIGTSLRSLSEPFGMQSYIGKKVVVYTDARVDGLPLKSLSTIAERLLAITGEDGQHINRKNQRYFDGQLTSRIVLFSNELPRFQDDSGALARRFLTWRMRQSFVEGRADPELTPKLLAERAGILNLALDALDRLRERGRLHQHASGEGMAANLTDLASNVRAFVEERCAVGAEYEILVDTLFNRFRTWCEQKGIKHAIGSNHFSTKIEAAVATVTSGRPRVDNPRRLTKLFGIGLRSGKGGVV